MIHQQGIDRKRGHFSSETVFDGVVHRLGSGPRAAPQHPFKKGIHLK